MSFLVNRAWVATATTGTGAITLGSAQSGYQSLASAGVASGDWVDYVIVDGSAWEHGIGQYNSSGPTLTRNLVESSTGSLVSLDGSATVFVTLSGQSLGGAFAHLFGTGADGSLSSGFGTITLTRDMCYNNIVFGPADQIVTNGYVLCALSCDLSNAAAGAIVPQSASSLTAGNASGSTAGSTPAALAGPAGASVNGSSAAAGTTTNGNSANNPSFSAAYLYFGGRGAIGGNGGSYGAYSGGSCGTASTVGTLLRTPVPLPPSARSLAAVSGTVGGFFSGYGGVGAGGGSGDGTNKGGGGGGSGGTPVPMRVHFRLLNTGTSTTAGLIAAKGGAGGTGGNSAGGNACGGGGGGGGGGGCIYCVIGTRIGSTVTNGFDVSSGAGGTGGNGTGGGAGGQGGSAGGTGGVEYIQVAGAIYNSLAPNIANVNTNSQTQPTGTAGSAGAAAVTAQMNL